jgi:hypothetical protein
MKKIISTTFIFFSFLGFSQQDINIENPINKSSKNLSLTNKPMIIVDETEVPNSILESIDPNQIKLITVYKGVDSFEKYGEKGKNGVIYVETKSFSNLKAVIQINDK